MCSAAGSTRSTSSGRAGRTRGSSGTPSVEGRPVGDEQRLAVAHRARRTPVRLEVLPEPLDLVAGAEDRGAPATPPTHPVGEGRPALLGGRRPARRWHSPSTGPSAHRRRGGPGRSTGTRCAPPRGPGRRRTRRAAGRVRTRRGPRRGRRATADEPGSACAARAQPRARHSGGPRLAPTGSTGSSVTRGPASHRSAAASSTTGVVTRRRGRQRTHDLGEPPAERRGRQHHEGETGDWVERRRGRPRRTGPRGVASR